jgi:hypothetical protein
MFPSLLQLWLANEKTKLNLTGGATHTSSPLVWLNDNEFLGGCDATLDYIRDEFMSGPKAVVGAAPQMKDDGVEMGKYDYDLVCIGGGSGGLAMTKEAVR